MVAARGSPAPTFCAGGLITAVIRSALTTTIRPGPRSGRISCILSTIRVRVSAFLSSTAARPCTCTGIFILLMKN